MNILSLLTGGLFSEIGSFLKTVRKVLTGDIDPDQKAKLLEQVNNIESQLLEARKQILQSQADIIKAESQSESWLTRNWRPLTMLLFVFMIFNNYVLAPYLQAFGIKTVILPIPEGCWDMIKIGLGGYIGGRSLEKIIKHLKTGQGA